MARCSVGTHRGAERPANIWRYRFADLQNCRFAGLQAQTDKPKGGVKKIRVKSRYSLDSGCVMIQSMQSFEFSCLYSLDSVCVMIQSMQSFEFRCHYSLDSVFVMIQSMQSFEFKCRYRFADLQICRFAGPD